MMISIGGAAIRIRIWPHRQPPSPDLVFAISRASCRREPRSPRIDPAAALSQIPGLSRKVRAVIDWTVSLPFSRDISEVGSIGHPRPLRTQVYEGGGSHRPLAAGQGTEAEVSSDG